MSFSPMDSRIFSPLFYDEEIGSLFSDEQLIARLVEVETALAAAQGSLGIIPAAAADQITEHLKHFSVDFDALQAGMEKAGVPVIALLKQLRQHIGPPAADHLHWGATTQDIMDTAVILQIRAALSLLETRLVTLIQQLAALSAKHRLTVMAGRTHSQQAVPITFGLKAAGWLAPFIRHHQRLLELKPRLLVVQFGGAAGTAAALGSQGVAVQQALAAQLDLDVPLLPWHTQRDNLGELAGWLSLVNGSAAKMAQDIILMAQTEIGEVYESADTSRGGSSTMPQKRNPMLSEQIIACARTNSNLLATMHQALIQEHERATHGWQMEWLNLPPMVGLTAVSLRKTLNLSQNLVVNTDRMQDNLYCSRGLLLAEAISFALTDHMDRTQAKQLVREACHIALTENRHLVDVVEQLTNLPLAWEDLKEESNYLGATTTWIEQVLQAASALLFHT